MEEMPKTNSPDWNFIIETIKEEKCIILLGPDVAKTANGNSQQQELLDYLDVKDNTNILKHYTQDELFLFRDKASKAKIYYRIKEFYNQIKIDNGIYSNIVKIPFHLMISISPDLFLKKAFDDNNIKSRFLVYNKTKNPEDLAPPKKENPVIYNLFGCTDIEESLILTHDDLFDFLLAVIGNKNLPTELRNTFQNAKNIIFLGFEFEKWYVQLLLRLLNLHNQYYEQAKYASKNTLLANHDIEDLCKAQFKIEFIDDDTERFINILYDKCNREGILRKHMEERKARELSPIEKTVYYLEQDQFSEALLSLKEYIRDINDNELNDTLTSISARYNRLARRIANGNISNKDADIDLNQLTADLLKFTKTVKSLETEKLL